MTKLMSHRSLSQEIPLLWTSRLSIHDNPERQTVNANDAGATVLYSG